MENNYDYSTAADYARLIGYHRTTIVKWIKDGKLSVVNKTVKSKKKNYNMHWKITNKSFQPCTISKHKKPYPKHYKHWSKEEIYILKNNLDKPASVLTEMLKRNENSIRIAKCRIKKDKNNILN